MTPQLLAGQLAQLEPDLRARGATGLSIFGSRARGDEHTTSDLDGLVDYDPRQRFSLLDLVAIERLVEERTGLKADFTTRPALHPLLRERIEREALRVF